VSAYTVDLARALPGPAWLRDGRVSAAERLVERALPSPAEEIWRYSRIDELDLDRFTPSVAGWSTSCTGPHVGGPDPVHPFWSADAPAVDVFAEQNRAFAPAPVVITVPAGEVVGDVVVVEHHFTADGIAAFPRLVVDAGPDSEVTVLERFSSGDITALVVPLTTIRAQAGARVRYLAVNELGTKVWQIAGQSAIGERDSSTLISSVALGGDYARVRTEARLVGQGADGRQVAVYFGEGHQMHDFRTLQEHIAPKTTSDLLFKGAVQDHARSVYTGLIRIGRDAKGANAFQTNRNIKLSEGAWAESVPNLDIENNDVRCSHASAVGPIDEDQRFYLESRGVPPAVAERLIVLGFFDDVITRLPVPSIADALRHEVAAKLARRSD